MAHSRRNFLKSTAAAALLGGGRSSHAAPAAKRLATDWVPLGNSGVKVTRLAFGTGTYSGRVQRELGQDEFTRQVRYAYDHGIRFFETAESYPGMPEMLSIALKGIPRDSYQLMMKCTVRRNDDPLAKVDQYRKQLNTEYLDILLLHCVTSPTWFTDMEKHRDGFSEAKQKKMILSHGASVHGLPALREFPGKKWLDVSMIRMNHKGTIMDGPAPGSSAGGNVPEVVQHTQEVHAQGSGVISMKLVGEGRFTNPDDRDAALRFAFNTAKVDAVTIGYKSTAEIDEALKRLNGALAVA
ncbi:MAG TPA: aldo/keto reductase [Candidatus Limnocylindrales bacterium]|nr:aldo/keto reductase [Candidatus Limnocylindrales bacterium]